MTVKRFYYVHSPRSTTLHRSKTRSEGLTHCGRALTIGWVWALLPARRLRRCKQCQNAA